MRSSSTILLRFIFVIVLKICSSSIVFRIHSNNKNVSIESSYLFGSVHVSHELIWPYLSNETLEILNNSDEIWAEHDFTDPVISKYIYSCSINTMPIKRRARLRAKTWTRFLNETKHKFNDQLQNSNNLDRWREWFAENEFLFNNYLWRNGSITNATIFDHRIILEAYQRGAYVGSLESLPDDCFSIEKSKTNKKEGITEALVILARAFNCDLIDEDFVKEISKNLDDIKMKYRNERITLKIRNLLTNNPEKKYVFVVGAAHLFGDISIVQMLQDQYPNDYYIEQIDLASENFPYQNCTDEEFIRLAKEINSTGSTLSSS